MCVCVTRLIISSRFDLAVCGFDTHCGIAVFPIFNCFHFVSKSINAQRATPNERRKEKIWKSESHGGELMTNKVNLTGKHILLSNLN